MNAPDLNVDIAREYREATNEGDWVAVDNGHGGRLVRRGSRFQRAGPWRKAGCDYLADRSFEWNAVLVYRRDNGRCQSCGRTVKPRTSGIRWGALARVDDPDAVDGQVQHILPRIQIAKLKGLVGDLKWERRWQHLNRNPSRASPSWYLQLGNCPHNLVTLCKDCHQETFKGLPGKPKFAGVPPPKPTSAPLEGYGTGD